MNTERNKKIEEILASLDGSPRAEAPNFFYTRLKARMEKGLPQSGPISWLLRPAYAFSVLAAVLLINALVILKGNSVTSNNDGTAINESETIQSIAAEFNLGDNNYVYNLNPEK